jgi:hypothetical protein
MACEKYSNSIMAAVLGGLSPEHETELREHVARCAACRGKFDQARAALDVADRGVEALVAGEPSAQFAARLRARIANELSPRPLDWRAWIPVAAGVCVLAASLVTVMIRTPRQTIVNSTPMAQNISNPEPEVPATGQGEVAGAPRTVRRTKSREVQDRRPEVLVPPGQLAAVMQFANAVDAGRVDGEQIAAAQEQSEEPLKIDAIQIAPLSIPEIDHENGAPGSPGGY